MIAIIARDPENALAFAEASLEHSIRHSAHWQVGMTLKLAAQLLLGHEIPLSALERIRERSEKMGELVTRNGAIRLKAVAYLYCGQIARGWRLMRQFEQLVAATGHIEARRHSEINRAEILLTLGGFIKTGAPRPKLGLGDIAVLIYLRLIARRFATAAANRLLAQFDRMEGHLLARALMSWQ